MGFLRDQNRLQSSGYSSLRLVLWDLSGVLLEDRSLDPDLLYSNVSLNRETWSAILATMLREEKWWDQVECGKASLAEFSKVLAERVEAAGGWAPPDIGRFLWWGDAGYPSGRRIHSGILELIVETHMRIGHAIATNNVREYCSQWQAALPMERFKHVFDSSNIGHRKPSVEFWRHIEATTGLRGEQILLVDDNSSNIRSAGEFGWRTAHFTDARAVREVHRLLSAVATTNGDVTAVDIQDAS